MRFKQLNIDVSYTFWIEKIDTKGLTFKQGDLGQLRLSQYTDALQLVIKGKLFTITLRDPALFNQIAPEFGRANANLIEVSRVHRQKDWPQDSVQLELSLASFNGPEIELGTLDIALDQRTLDQAELTGLGQNFKDVKASLEKGCSLNLTDEPEEQYAIVMLGESALDQLKHIQKSEDQTVPLNREAQQQIKSGLVLLGDNLQLAIQQFSAVEFDYLGVRKLVTRSQSAPTRTLRLVKVKLKFTEHRAQIASLATQQLSKILADQKGYLSTWDRYGASEGEQLLKRARSIGKIEIASYNIGGESGDVMSIYVEKDLRELLTPQDSVLMVSPNTAIPHLDEPDMDWQTFSSRMLEEYKATKGFDSGLSSWEQKVVAESESSDSFQDGVVDVPQSELDQTQSFKVIKVEQHCVVVKNETLPSQNMVLALSILGDQIQIERRMAARSAIVEGKSAMPHLGLLIEDGGMLPIGRSQRPTIEPLTNFVENKIFPKNKPTAVQKKAIEIALNTPDIAIIQGPPGTGKTTVITAIIERLNQELDKSKSVQGDILVSGYQHDAVENLLNRLSVNDLPAIKFGQRSGESAQSNSTNIKLDEWRKQTLQRVFQHSPGLRESVAFIQLERDAKAYNKRPSNSAALRLLNKANTLITGLSGSHELVALLKDLIHELANQHHSNLEGLSLLRSLRLTSAGFKDDGVDRATALMTWLEKQEIHLKEDYLEVLRNAIAWEPEQKLDFLPKLQEVKLLLLKKITPRPQLKRVMVREDVQIAIQKSLDLLQEKESNNGKERALIEYLSDLEGNSNLVQEALSEYNLVYGATVQQSEGSLIRRYKSKANDGKGYLEYGTVIVDEAARTSPRDLMIPMVQAKDRIILVGDHRQLPHIVDESLLKQMEQELEVADLRDGRVQFNQHIKESMFQYLFNRAKQLEQQDGKQRTITLDAQYRSHPLLGKFASEQFYAPYNEPYKSPLEEDKFDQRLDGIESKAAVWLDVPAQRGSEERDASKSRFRRAEAKVIAKQLKKWIDSEQGKNLSFGVISFYKAQVNEVMEELSKFDITERDEQGNYAITREYQVLFDKEGKPSEERLRVGTVDSFQGMEFDVVFLSMVRTPKSNSSLTNRSQSSLREQQSVFGHLMSKNRLCVSVTRQKKSLVVVGDAHLIQSPMAKEAVPELHAFYQLCNGSEGALI
ncbi:hypothetical protein VroAM7_15990 [Vibrio rotiferianus]|uniref:AAA+ ATPase domain-containing protein n=1 Tax=Vibrio rotiferianus TaxID=190895 RepID=A0A510I959_9VIBR|nr:AAA domain-containing protein [Vibrio rotiferianus]BBL88946.1 hypothetical protein VroAM7_15990 [Vibrio rotiferianus]